MRFRAEFGVVLGFSCRGSAVILRVATEFWDKNAPPSYGSRLPRAEAELIALKKGLFLAFLGLFLQSKGGKEEQKLGSRGGG